MIIELNNVCRQYHGNPKSILDSVSLNISAGSAIAIVGPSGSGKSTLLNLIGTLDYPTTGHVFLDGISTSSLTPEQITSTRNTKIGFVFQMHLLLPQLTVIENVLLPVIPQRKSDKKAVSRALELLEIVGIADKAKRFPGEMSVGECQRVAVVRALINEPELLLMDEPTGSLDHDSAENLSDMILNLRKKKSFTLLTVTHSPELASRMDIIYKLVNGKITTN